MNTYELYLIREYESNKELLEKIASLCSAYLGAEVYVDDIEVMMVLLEIARRKAAK